MAEAQLEKATLAGGCFWCTEAIFRRLKGVIDVDSGYSGGQMDNPSYEEVSSGNTGHAEAIQMTFDPSVISYETILEVFWATHDPTTLNRQGNDSGSQYRSMIFYHNDAQKAAAEKSLAELKSQFKDPIVTDIEPFQKFYKAEDYHQGYYENNRSNNAYCPLVIDPKIHKLLEKFGDKVKPEYLQKHS
jgi:peptide-methionine (S)-S-oxide reductase